MIHLYFWPTPNGHKISIALEEMGLEYKIHPLNLAKAEQKTPAYLKLNPNGRMPAIVDDAPATGDSISVWESGAILQYLGEKSGKLLPANLAEKYATISWVSWQISALGPMLGQAFHFKHTQKDPQIPIALDRYMNESKRLISVMEATLSQKEYLTGEFSIADVACWPWLRSPERFGLEMASLAPSVHKWILRIAERPAVKRAIEIGEAVSKA